MSAQTFDGVAILGFNASQIDGDRLAGYNKLGVNAGGKVHARLGDHFSLGLEMLFTQKGSRSGINQTTPNNAFKIRLDYAEIPILLHYHDKERAIFGAGVAYGAFFGYKRIEAGVNTTDDEPPVFSRDVTGLLDLVLIAAKQFGINFRFAYSILPIEHWPGSPLPDFKVYNNLLSFRLMWFPRKR